MRARSLSWSFSCALANNIPEEGIPPDQRGSRPRRPCVPRGPPRPPCGPFRNIGPRRPGRRLMGPRSPAPRPTSCGCVRCGPSRHCGAGWRQLPPQRDSDTNTGHETPTEGAVVGRDEQPQRRGQQDLDQDRAPDAVGCPGREAGAQVDTREAPNDQGPAKPKLIWPKTSWPSAAEATSGMAWTKSVPTSDFEERRG